MDTGRIVAVKQVPEKLSVKQGRGFFREVASCLKADRPRVVLDCSKVRQLDSAGIQVLLQCLEEAMKRNGDVKLASVPSGAAAILELTRVDRLFEMFDSTADAVNSFRQFPMKPIEQPPGPEYSTVSSGARPDGLEDGHSECERSPDSERTMGFSGRWLRWQIAGCLAVLLVAPLAAASASPQQETNVGQEVSSTAPSQSQGSVSVATKDSPATSQPEALPNSALPNSPGAGRSQTADDNRPSGGQQTSTSQQHDVQEPLGTAAAPLVTTTGVAASRPAGAAIAPAKQRRARSILIKVSAIVGAGAAIGIVLALAKASPSQPSGSR
jgi:anti-sigma B factor antagonist